ncbi:DNA-binding transcriptional regulator, AcrR family [Amycolatopsis arida]|uniref:DNA-binding transcriptional regulator, AcrR family n=1 Tax=Amycolatopsis arida TaxID=587909 RepID=A0A1I5M5M8_9PSEU|nr:TetR/AcrR family transcriptional regulator [Amycolatopsis arida]TDX93978.1 AcrR family transcriptional regulator [Amycolatopsis arida]SFP04839.1 DNA-binding transcriptional regulator, AcrR family [Amycolatopsis arida]
MHEGKPAVDEAARPAPAADATLGRSARKRAAILAAARTVFLRKGYDGTSMDEVAALAAVSKQTVYKHFADKERLFTAIVTGDISATEALTADMVAALGGSDDVPADLRRFARRHIVEVTQPHLIRLRRIIIAEAERFPELARTWYASGPERAHALLAEQLDALARRGLLRVADPLLAAQHLNWLILSIPLNRAMFLGADTALPPGERDRCADEAVRVFLAAYGPAAADDPASR